MQPTTRISQHDGYALLHWCDTTRGEHCHNRIDASMFEHILKRVDVFPVEACSSAAVSLMEQQSASTRSHILQTRRYSARYFRITKLSMMDVNRRPRWYQRRKYNSLCGLMFYYQVDSPGVLSYGLVRDIFQHRQEWYLAFDRTQSPAELRKYPDVCFQVMVTLASTDKVNLAPT